MRQFDICTNPNTRTRGRTPFLLVVQADLLSGLATRVVVPLVDMASIGSLPIGGLMPVFEVESRIVVALIPEMAGISLADIGAVVSSAIGRRSDIIAALDLLITGF
jgi:toxin CcdB